MDTAGAMDTAPSVGPDAALDAGAWQQPDAAVPLPSSGWDAAVTIAQACEVGEYMGTFTCTYSMFPDGGAGFFDFNVDTPVSGGVSLRIASAADVELVAIGNGELSGNAELLYDFQATLEGTLDCVQGRYQGVLVGGKASFFGIELLDFQGDLEATYDGDAGRFDGQWTLNVLTGGRCVGTWNAAYVGP